MRSKARAFGASLVAAVAAWLTFAPVVLTGQGAHRIAVLSARPWPIAAAARDRPRCVAGRTARRFPGAAVSSRLRAPSLDAAAPASRAVVVVGSNRLVRVGRRRGRLHRAAQAFRIESRTLVVAAGAIAFIVYGVAARQASPIAARGRRAGISGHHAEPSLRPGPAHREQPSPGRLSRLLCRRAAPELSAARTRRRDLFDTRPGDSRARAAGFRNRRLSGRRRLPRAGVGARERPRVARRAVASPEHGSGLVRVGCRQLQRDGGVSKLLNLSGRRRRCAGPDR